MKLTVVLCTLSLHLLAASGPITPEILAPYAISNKTEVVGVSHAPLDAMLKKYVSADGKVDYESFKNDPTLDRYIGMLGSVDPGSLSTKEQMAYWINAYNAFTIKLVLDNYPVKSIKDVGSPWDKKFIRIMGKVYSLNQIENEILRPQFGDARIHFAINCASISCPKLHNAAFTAENLEGKLDQLTRAFVNDASMNQISAGSVKISELFNWYGVDFKKNGTLIDWLNKYSDVKINANATISNMKYNWNLNKK